MAAGGAMTPFRGLATSWDQVPGRDLTAMQAPTAGPTEAGKGGDELFPTSLAPRFPVSLQGARPKQREQKRDQEAGIAGRRSTGRESREGMGRYPLNDLDQARLHYHLRELPQEPQAGRESQPPCVPERVGDAEGRPERVEVMGVWRSRNGRLHLMDVLKAGPGGTWSSELQSQVIWESVQDAAGNFDLAKLQEAIAEVHRDFEKLTKCQKGGRSKEELAAGLSRFHYFPDEPTLQLTLEQLEVQRKLVLWGVAPHAWRQEEGPREAVGRRGLGAPPPPPLSPWSSVTLARVRQREGLQGPPTGRSWVDALRRCFCHHSCSQGEESEEEKHSMD